MSDYNKNIILPEYDKNKINLPKREDFISSISWIRALKNELGENVIFALDEALMCEDLFLGRNYENFIWVYGDDSLSKYNGVVILGNNVDSKDIKERDGIKFTKLNKTLTDAFVYENILDMQGITEALSDYYYSNNENFSNLCIPEKYKDSFDKLANDAIEYYIS